MRGCYEFGQRSSAAASLGSTSSSARPPAQAAHCHAGPSVTVHHSATPASSNSTPGQDLYPAAGPAAFESPCPEVATRPVASINNGCQPSAGRVPDKGGARWSACPGSLPRPPVLSEELVPG